MKTENDPDTLQAKDEAALEWVKAWRKKLPSNEKVKNVKKRNPIIVLLALPFVIFLYVIGLILVDIPAKPKPPKKKHNLTVS